MTRKMVTIDGNTAASDGCDGSCVVEAGWSC